MILYTRLMGWETQENAIMFKETFSCTVQFYSWMSLPENTTLPLQSTYLKNYFLQAAADDLAGNTICAKICWEIPQHSTATDCHSASTLGNKTDEAAVPHQAKYSLHYWKARRLAFFKSCHINGISCHCTKVCKVTNATARALSLVPFVLLFNLPLQVFTVPLQCTVKDSIVKPRFKTVLVQHVISGLTWVLPLKDMSF